MKIGNITAIIAMASLLSLAFACGKDDGGDTVPGLAVRTNPAQASATVQDIEVLSAGGSWDLSIAFEGTETGWAHVDVNSGSGRKSGIKFRYDQNTGTTSRYCTLTASSSVGSTSIRFRQYGTSEGKPEIGRYGAKAALQDWLELPATSASDGMEFFSIPMTIGGVTCRNYSFYYSYSDLDAIWVAYPLNKWTIGGNIGRSEAWAYYPGIPEEYQQYVVQSYGNGYTRGHQIPSADRLGIVDKNAATFYAVNMTPQNGDFNGGIWVNLEDKVRKIAQSCDTLYVVTGCVLGSRKVSDRMSNSITVPEAYFKALLAYGSTYGKIQRFSGVGVYFNHDGSISSTDKLIKYSMSLAELEKKTGISFFPNLALQFGERVANDVKNQQPQSWLPSTWK